MFDFEAEKIKLENKIERMYKAICKNSEALANGGSHFYYTRANDKLSELITAAEKRIGELTINN